MARLYVLLVLGAPRIFAFYVFGVLLFAGAFTASVLMHPNNVLDHWSGNFLVAWFFGGSFIVSPALTTLGLIRHGNATNHLQRFSEVILGPVLAISVIYTTPWTLDQLQLL